MLGLLVGVLVGGGWLLVAVATRSAETPTAATAAAGPATAAAPAPALERVVPSVAAVQVPTPRPRATSPATSPSATSAPPPVQGGPCSDGMIRVEVRPSAPAVAVGDKPTLDLVVTNTSAVSCVRALDKGLQEIVLLDAAGRRVWGSNDCFPEASHDTRTLAPGQVVDFPVVWGGLTSEPTCTAPRVRPSPGRYVLRGRLDTKLSPDAALTLT